MAPEILPIHPAPMTPRAVKVARFGTERARSFEWRHRLMWRQLSVLWQLPICECIPGEFSSLAVDSPLSMALAHGEYYAEFLAQCRLIASPKVIFLDRVRLAFSSGGGFAARLQERYSSGERFAHVFRIKQNHPLTAGLPEKVAIYGACPIVTPLQTEDGIEVLVSLGDVSVIGKRERDLIIGADPWQLGSPSVPMLYKVLSNWLIHELKLKLRLLKPYAAIRLDDLPITAEQLATNPSSRKSDGSRARTIRRLRNFAARNDAKFTLMYSSHYHGPEGALKTIASLMPRSIGEIQAGVAQGVFEIGSHGMVHLRDGLSNNGSYDPREFLDLDEEKTAAHLQASRDEIQRLFGVDAQSFVAPAWGYRPGVTKRVAAARFPIIIDSSQHLEHGSCDEFLSDGREGHYFNMIETFRDGVRMLTYGNPEFWQCYARAGIPIHYMQHTDTNWHLLRGFLKTFINSVEPTSRNSFAAKMFAHVENPASPRYLRAFGAIVLALTNLWRRPDSWSEVWMILSRSSLYSIVRATKRAGYRCVTLSESKAILMNQPT